MLTNNLFFLQMADKKHLRDDEIIEFLMTDDTSTQSHSPLQFTENDNIHETEEQNENSLEVVSAASFSDLHDDLRMSDSDDTDKDPTFSPCIDSSDSEMIDDPNENVSGFYDHNKEEFSVIESEEVVQNINSSKKRKKKCKF